MVASIVVCVPGGNDLRADAHIGAAALGFPVDDPDFEVGPIDDRKRIAHDRTAGDGAEIVGTLGEDLRDPVGLSSPCGRVKGTPSKKPWPPRP